MLFVILELSSNLDKVGIPLIIFTERISLIGNPGFLPAWLLWLQCRNWRSLFTPGDLDGYWVPGNTTALGLSSSVSVFLKFGSRMTTGGGAGVSTFLLIYLKKLEFQGAEGYCQVSLGTSIHSPRSPRDSVFFSAVRYF